MRTQTDEILHLMALQYIDDDEVDGHQVVTLHLADALDEADDEVLLIDIIGLALDEM